MDIDALVSKMTLEEKVALCSGASFWQTKAYEEPVIPALFLSDGPHGLRKQERTDGTDMLGVNESTPATCFPAEATTASSWDPELLREVGAAIGREARAQGVGVVLGPGANMKRNPLCGRNFEYFSEDPLLAGKLASGFIQGVEAQGVGSSLKHFAANSQELSRFNSNSVMDERALRELYLPAFETAVKEGHPSTVMCAYPLVNGVHCSDNTWLLNEVLRDEWGFEGMVVTDWGAMNDRIEGFRAGCDLNMPGGSEYMEAEVVAAVRAGNLPESAVDASARRVAELALREATVLAEPASFDKDAHHDLARRAAEQGAVLLKNEGRLLPLAEGAKVAVIGHMAEEMRFQGAGSSHINPTRTTQPLEALEDVAYARGCDARGDTTEELLAEAAAAASGADVAVVFAGLPARYESEGFDRDDMRMPEGHLRMIERVAAANPNTVVVLMCGSVVECPWADDVRSILWVGLPGQAGGLAIANLLYGRANPCGKLAESWPLVYADCVSSGYYGKQGRDALYLEGIYTGYRYYDKACKDVRWPFGFGLSYSTFEYANLRFDGTAASLSVTNTGEVEGSEIVQIYVEAPQDGVHRPLRILAGFGKVTLAPQESMRISIPIDRRSFSVWQDGWKVPGGDYRICAGSSSRNLPLEVAVHLDGEPVEMPSWQAGSWYETCAGVPAQADLEAAMGTPYHVPKLEKGRFTMDNTVEEMKDYSLVMRIMYKAVESTIAKGFGGKVDYENPEFRMLMASSAGGPLRSMQISGGMKGGVLPGMLEMANGHYLRGIRRMLLG